MGGENDIGFTLSAKTREISSTKVRPLHEGQMDVFLPPTNSPWTSRISGEGETHVTEGC